MAKAKGLNALKRIKQGKFVTCNVCDATMHGGCLCCVKQLAKCKDLVTIQKELKALEIIKNKQLDVLYLCLSKTLEAYNKHVSFIVNEWCLTQEEYDLLKEVLQ